MFYQLVNRLRQQRCVIDVVDRERRGGVCVCNEEVSKHVSFATSLKQLLKTEGIENFSALAKRLDIQRSTVSHHISVLERTMDLDSPFLARVAQELGLAPRKLAEQLEDMRKQSVELTDLVSDLRIPEIPPPSFFQSRMEEIFEALPRGAIYRFATHEPPWEFNRPDFQNVIANALKKGVRICYYFPDPRREGAFRETYLNLLGRADLAWTTLADSYLEFKGMLSMQRLKDQELSLLCAYQTDSMFLCNPLQRLAYFCDDGDNSNDHDGYAIIECVFGADTAFASSQIWQPLNTKQTAIVKRAFDLATIEKNMI